MQPTQRFKKTLLASALVLGVCSTFNVSAKLLTVTASAVPDVSVEMASGYTEVSFGEGIIGTKSGESCVLKGFTGIGDAALMWDADGNDAEDAAVLPGALSGDACLGSVGKPMVIEIDGADSSTVSVTVADVTGSNQPYTYTPTADSCVIDFDRTTAADTCKPLTTNTVTGIGMSVTQTDGAGGGSVENVGVAYGYAAISGKTRMVLGGKITLNGVITDEAVISDSIVVQVTYE